MRVFLSFLLIAQSFGWLPFQVSPDFSSLPTAEAFVDLNSSEWYQTVDFLGNQAWVTTGYNVTYNTSAGFVKGTVARDSYIYLSEVRPVSFRWWDELIIKYTGNPENIYAQVLTCNNNGWSLLKTVWPLPINGKIDISDIDHIANPCIQTLITFGDTTVVLDEVKTTWEPLPLYSVAIDAPETKPSCGTTSFTIAYSLSYASDTDVVLYSRLPNSTYGTVTWYTTSYNQFPAFLILRLSQQTKVVNILPMQLR
jgi:hypothetical protein